MTTIAITITHIDFKKVALSFLFLAIISGLVYISFLVLITFNLHQQKLLNSQISDLKTQVINNEQALFAAEQKVVPALILSMGLSNVESVSYSKKNPVATSR